MSRFLGIGCLLVLLLAPACSSGPKQDPIMVLSSAEALAKGKELMEQEKYRQAREYLVHAFEVEPNSEGGREALLLAADAYYLAGGLDNYVRAQARYRDFQTRFPLSEKSAYVQYQIGMSLLQRMKKPDRDQSISRDALKEFRAVRELYPTSEYAELAEEQIERVRQNLAAHEMLVGRFYMRYGNYNGAIKRFEYLLENYPEFDENDRVLYYLGMTHRKAEQEAESRQVFERLRREYPDSSFVEEIPEPRDDPGVDAA